MCEAKKYYVLRELGTLMGMHEFYRQVAGIGGKKVIEAIERRADELLREYDDEEQELQNADFVGIS